MRRASLSGGVVVARMTPREYALMSSRFDHDRVARTVSGKRPSNGYAVANARTWSECPGWDTYTWHDTTIL